MRRARPLAFADFLRLLPPAVVFERVVKKQGAGRKIISAKLIDEVTGRFLRPETLHARFESLSEEARAICALAYCSGRTGVRAIDDPALHSELFNSFLVYVASDEEGGRYYFGFDDMARPLTEALRAWVAGKAFGAPPAPHAPQWLWRSVNDFAVFLALACQGQITLTQKGDPVRAALTLVRKLFNAGQEQNQYADADIRALVELHIAFGRHIGALAVRGKEVSVSRTGADIWLKKKHRDQFEAFRRFALELIGSWRLDTLSAMIEARDDGWLPLSLFSHVREQATPAIRILEYVGALECAAADGQWWVRLAARAGNEMAPGDARPIALPDFSVMLPQECAPHTLFAFSALGRLQSFDRVYKGQIDRTTVNSALADEIPGERLLGYLDDWQAPDNVRITVDEWIREFGRLSQSAADILTSADERTTMQIEGYEPICQYIEAIEAHKVFRIKPGCARRVWEMLSNMGFDPRLPMRRELPAALSAADRLDTVEQSRSPELTIETDFSQVAQQESRRMSAGKYSPELKELELTEMFHVIDYAILMGCWLNVDYEGSPYIKAGEYRLLPAAINKGAEPTVEGAVEPTRKAKKMYIKRIKRIGVEPA